MREPMPPAVMVRQVEDLPALTGERTPLFDQALAQVLGESELASAQRVFLTGDGDSYHAAEAAVLAFKELGNISCEALSAQRFLDYAVEYLAPHRPESILVVAVSASGRTERGLQALEKSAQMGFGTLALTGTAGSPFTEAAAASFVVEIPDFGRSPGIRTYNASLMGLLLLAIRLAQSRKRLSAADAENLVSEMQSLAEGMEQTLRACRDPARQAAEAYQDANKMVFAGSGPSYGTALFSAAKVVEAAGVFALGQDLEEWSHVERFAHPHDLPDMPTLIIAPPGRSHWRAVTLAELAQQLGRRVAVVCQQGDEGMSHAAQFVFPISEIVREIFSPLVYHIPATYFAAYLTETLGRMCFRTDQALPA